MIYSIKKGRHYCTPHFPRLHFSKGKELLEVTFNESHLYQFGTEDDLDVNKLHGRTFGWNVHTNSYRIGWRPSSSFIELFHYAYVNGQRVIKIFDIVHLYKKIQIPIDYNYNGGYIKVADEVTSFNFSNAPDWGLKCYPYFGGNMVAPHTIKTSLNLIK